MVASSHSFKLDVAKFSLIFSSISFDTGFPRIIEGHRSPNSERMSFDNSGCVGVKSCEEGL